MAEDKYITWNAKIIARGEYETDFCVVKIRKSNGRVNNTLSK